MSTRGRDLAAAGLVLAIAAAAGAVTLVVELSAVRLLAPWFGASTRVWTNVIAAILAALSLGYLLGARWSTSAAPMRFVALVLGAGGCLAAWLPGLSPVVAGWFIPQGVRLEQAASLATFGSLACALILFAPPAICLGAVSPLAGEQLARVLGLSSGQASGRVLCVSTLGSLVGSFLATHAMVPMLGLTRTFLWCGASLWLLALAALWSSRGYVSPAGWPSVASKVVSGLFAVLALGAGLVSRWRAPQPQAPNIVLEELQSAYQFVRVVEDHSIEPAWRLVQVNEGLDSFQSVWSPTPGLLGQGLYYDYFALPAWLETRPGRWRVLVLGLGGGTAFGVLSNASPENVELDLWGVELDPAMVEVGQRWMELDKYTRSGQVLAGEDARSALRRLPLDFDLIVLDAYAHQVEIPAHLMTKEFLDELESHLRPGGWCLVNAGGFGADDPVVRAVRATLCAAFEQDSVALRVPRSRNWIVGARRNTPWPDPMRADGDVARALLGPLHAPGSVVRGGPSSCGAGDVLTDDKSDMELRQMASLAAAQARDV